MPGAARPSGNPQGDSHGRRMWLGAALCGLLAACAGVDPAPVAAAGNTPETLTQEMAGTLATAAGPGVQSALPAAPRGIPARRYNVADSGARPDDGLDDTAAIQATLDAAAAQGGGHVVFPGGRYDLSVQPPGPGHPHPWALRLSSRLHLGPSAPGQLPVLRLADAQGDYESLMATAEYAAPLEDFVLERLTIDGNGQGNPVRRPSQGADNSPDFGSGDVQTPRSALRAYKGQRILVRGVRFVNQTNVNVITFNGPEMSDADIRDSSFEAVGNGPVGGQAADFDHSSIYTDGPRMRVFHNRFTSRFGPGTPGARTAIETHGADQSVEANTIDGFLTGINVVGVGAGGGARQVYRNNVVRGANTGLLLWSQGAGLQGVSITGNQIDLVNTPWLGAGLVDQETRVTGISVEGGSDAAITGLNISGNTIAFGPVQSLNPYRDGFSNGIQLWSYKAPDLSVSGLSIRGNRVVGSLGAGIRSEVAIVGTGANEIAGNVIVGPVRTTSLHSADLGARQLHSGIYLVNRSRNLRVTGNSVQVQAGSFSDLQFGVTAASTCEAGCLLQGNTLAAAGVTPSFADPS